MSFEKSALSVNPKNIRRQLGAVRVKSRIVTEQQDESLRLREEAEQNVLDVQYEMDGSEVRVT